MLLAVLAALPTDFLPLLDGELPSTPQAGEPAYTWYHGNKFVGTLAKCGYRLDYTHVVVDGRTFTAQQFGRFHDDNYIYIGYDGRTQWDAEVGMWSAHADHD